MKVKFLMLILVAVGSLFSAQLFAKEVTDTVKVLGNCESCKERIEKAAKTAGATKADWSEKTQVLTVSYDDANTNLISVEKKIAMAGHDTRDIKATELAYSKLHSCCQYDRTGLSGAKVCEKEEKH